MQTLRNRLIAVATLGVLVVIGSLMNSHSATAQPGTAPPKSSGSAPVTIVSPIPLPITGSTTVSGAVAATQSGTWNVGITGNSGANPVLVRDVDNPARRPFQIMLCGGGKNGVSFCNLPVLGAPGAPSAFVVPPGQQLVLRFVSGSCIATNTDNLNLNLKTTVAGATVGYPLFPVQSRFPLWGVTQEVYISADPGTNVALETIEQSANSALGCKFALSGYTVTQ